jgi:hypothetical protein
MAGRAHATPQGPRSELFGVTSDGTCPWRPADALLGTGGRQPPEPVGGVQIAADPALIEEPRTPTGSEAAEPVGVPDDVSQRLGPLLQNAIDSQVDVGPVCGARGSVHQPAFFAAGYPQARVRGRRFLGRPRGSGCRLTENQAHRRRRLAVRDGWPPLHALLLEDRGAGSACRRLHGRGLLARR